MIYQDERNARIRYEGRDLNMRSDHQGDDFPVVSGTLGEVRFRRDGADELERGLLVVLHVVGVGENSLCVRPEAAALELAELVGARSSCQGACPVEVGDAESHFKGAEGLPEVLSFHDPDPVADCVGRDEVDLAVEHEAYPRSLVFLQPEPAGQPC